LRTFLAAGAVALAVPAAPARAEGLDEITPEAIAAVQADCRARPYSLLATIRNIRDARGILTIDLHGDDPAIWLKKGSKLARVRARAAKGQIEVCVPVERPGSYALAVYQDKDVNFEMNRNFLGLPAEPYGVSNDPSMNFGLPNMKDSLVAVHGPLTPVRVSLHN
jgi:uncharacterized protein (DUF2141 family)